MTPSAARRSGRPPGMLPRPAGGTPSRGAEGVSLKVLKTCGGWSKKLPIPLTPLSHCAKRWSGVAPLPSKGCRGSFPAKVLPVSNFCGRGSENRTFWALFVQKAFLQVEQHCSSTCRCTLPLTPLSLAIVFCSELDM